jgi:hypothetical protein
MMRTDKMFLINDMSENRRGSLPASGCHPCAAAQHSRRDRNCFSGEIMLDFLTQLSILNGFGQLHDYFA